MKKVVLFWVSCLVFLGMVGGVWASNNSKVKIYNSQGKLIEVYSSKKQPRQVELVSEILGDAGGKAEGKGNFLFKRPRHAKLKATYVLFQNGKHSTAKLYSNREALIKVKLLKVKVKLTKKQYRQLLELSK